MSLSSKIQKAINAAIQEKDVMKLSEILNDITMQKHTKIYFEFFDIAYFPGGEHEHIDCEVCNGTAVDIHHIIKKSQGGKDEISNLIALCRDCHDLAHDEKLSIDQLRTYHESNISIKKPNS